MHAAWNMGCILYIFWISLSCIIQFVNGIIWRDNAILWPGTTVWCDIGKFNKSAIMRAIH